MSPALPESSAPPSASPGLLKCADGPPSTKRNDLLRNASGAWEGTAASLVAHYLSAVRVARRATQVAYAEGRLRRGKVLKVWFCQQVFAAWEERRWTRASHPRTCSGREGERGRMESVARREPAARRTAARN